MLKWLYKLFGKPMPQDQVKIDAKIQELKTLTTHDWIAVEGYHALTSVQINSVSSSTSANFNPGSGIPVKAFIDTITGEIKVFPYKLFES